MYVTIVGVALANYGEIDYYVVELKHVPIAEVTPEVIEHVLRTPDVDEVHIVAEKEFAT